MLPIPNQMMSPKTCLGSPDVFQARYTPQISHTDSEIIMQYQNVGGRTTLCG